MRIGGSTSGLTPRRNPLTSWLPNVPVDLLARERGTKEPHHVAHLTVGLLERDAVPPFDDHVRRGPDAEGEPARGGIGEAGDRLGQARRTTGERRDDGRPEP